MNITNSNDDIDQSVPVDSLGYEQAFSELEEIVLTLEQNNQSLEAAMQLFERGQTLARYCASRLDQAELKIQQITGGVMTDFSPEG
jgi:exodeoxyribonuclease VII small subunit